MTLKYNTIQFYIITIPSNLGLSLIHKYR